MLSCEDAYPTVLGSRGPDRAAQTWTSCKLSTSKPQVPTGYLSWASRQAAARRATHYGDQGSVTVTQGYSRARNQIRCFPSSRAMPRHRSYKLVLASS